MLKSMKIKNFKCFKNETAFGFIVQRTGYNPLFVYMSFF